MPISEKRLRSVFAFAMGFIVAMNIKFLGDMEKVDTNFNSNNNNNNNNNNNIHNSNINNININYNNNDNNNNNIDAANTAVARRRRRTSLSSSSPLDGKRILVAITAFDFSQAPHLEEVVDSYEDLCVTGASKIDIVVYTTHAYPVPLIDLWNSRIHPSCKSKKTTTTQAPEESEPVFSLSIIVKPYSLRLFLVDCHRYLFYEKLNEYDLFIYTEDDMIVHPKLIASYLYETDRVIDIVGLNKSQDFNVGIVRYEYNFPSNVVIDDNTRHSTQNVTRVYWEHFEKPIFQTEATMILTKKGKLQKRWIGSSRRVRDPQLEKTHIQMINHHQGMYMVTPYLLKAWKDRPGCDFANVRKHPNIPTQRVWMSSFMMYGYPPGKGGPKACNVQQVIPIDAFGTLNVYHLPNKNHRRVGKYQNRTMSDGTEPNFDYGSEGLVTAMKFHIEMVKNMEQKPVLPYNGIKMIDERLQEGGVDDDEEELMETDTQRFMDFDAYVKRGGILSESDMKHTALMEGDTLRRQINKQKKEQRYNKKKKQGKEKVAKKT